MRFHQYPTASISANTYTIWVDGVSSNATMIGGTYDWSSMATNPASSSTTLANRQAIGKLTYDVGVACYMAYTSSGSGAYDPNFVDALKNQFGYANAIIMMNQSSGVDGSLTNAALSNLDAKYPVLFGISGDGGHEVVGDGYGYIDRTLYVHLNMGWAGSYNAWYNLPSFTAYYSFTMLDSIVYNVFPTSSVEVISGRVLDLSGLAVSGATVVATNQSTSAGVSAVVTDANGVYALLVPEPTAHGPQTATATYTITASLSGRKATASATVKASKSTSYTYYPSTGGMSYTVGSGTVGNSGGNDLMLPDPLPDAPAGVSASDGASTVSVAVSWASASYATGYKVYRYTSSASNSASVVGSVAATNYSDTTATSGTLYYYWVKATNTAGTSAFSAYDAGYRALSAPAGVTAGDGASTASVLLSWSASTGASGYSVYRHTADTSASASLIASTASTTYSDATAASGTLYNYWVKATNSLCASAFSASDSGYAALSAPTNVVASDGDSTSAVAVAWSSSANATGYGVYRSATNTLASAALIGGASTTNYSDAAATPGMLYYYWVEATNRLCASAVSVSDSGYRALSAPANVAASDSSTSAVEVTWGAVTGASYYRVYRAATSTGTKSALGDWQTALTYSDTTAAVGTTNYYWVAAAVDASGTRASAYSDYDTGVRLAPYTVTTEVPVPFAWLDAYGLVTGGDYEAAALADTDGDGYAAWQEYVAGTVPTNASSIFLAFIALSNGAPVVTWSPDLGTQRLYDVTGKSALTNAAWLAPTNAASRFFRVLVSPQ